MSGIGRAELLRWRGLRLLTGVGKRGRIDAVFKVSAAVRIHGHVKLPRLDSDQCLHGEIG